MLVYTRQKNIAQVFILERYFFDVYILASRTRLRLISDITSKNALKMSQTFFRNSCFFRWYVVEFCNKKWRIHIL